MRHHLFGESLDGFVEESLRHPALVEHRELNVEVECFADPIRFVDDLIGAPAHRKGTDAMKSWIHFSKGQVPHQAHVGVGDLKEDELGRQGFSGRVAELYHVNEPTGWTRIEGPLRPWDVDSNKLTPSDQDLSLIHI